MKNLIMILLVGIGWSGQAQGVIGTWQLLEEKTCFTSQFEKSDTETELEQSMGSSIPVKISSRKSLLDLSAEEVRVASRA